MFQRKLVFRFRSGNNPAVRAEDIWYGKTPSASFLRALLTPASLLYAAGWKAYLAIYDFGLKKAREPHCPVICVGNLVVGGSGKSPLTLHLARLIKELGKQVVISCSGYGSPAAEAAQLAPEGPLDARKWGDEPAMFRLLMPEMPLIVGRRRVLAAEICAERFPQAVLLLDDGFQHLPLQKHLTIVIDDAQPPNPRCLPAGPYREPRRGRRRADILVPGRFRVSARIAAVETPDGIDAPIPAKADILCALGRPESFIDVIRALGVELATVRALPDHDPMDAGNLFQPFDHSLPLVVTAKDWVKLRERPDVAERHILIAKQQIEVVPAEEFRTWIADKLDGFSNK